MCFVFYEWLLLSLISPWWFYDPVQFIISLRGVVPDVEICKNNLISSDFFIFNPT